HRYLGTPRDTKAVIFTRLDGVRFYLFVLKSCLGLQLFAIAAGYFSAHGPSEKSAAVSARQWIVDILRIVFAPALLFGAVSSVGGWALYLWLWVLPWLTVNRMINGLRSVIEHQPLAPERHPFTRQLRPTLLDRVLLCRVGFEYHRAHHRDPSVPYFNLHL